MPGAQAYFSHLRGDRLLERQEAFAGEVVLGALCRAGVDVRLGTEVTACGRPDAEDTGLGRVHGGPVTLQTSSGEVIADELLLAIGRRPRLHGVGLEKLGLDRDAVLRGELPAWLHVVGDASGAAPLTHWGKYRARVVGERIAAQGATRCRSRRTPRCLR